MLAIPWYFTKEGLGNRFVVIYFLVNIVTLFWSPLAGVLVDKYNRKSIFLTLMAIAGSIVLGVTATGFYLGELPWILIASVFAITFWNYNLHYPTLYAFAQEITEQEHYGKIASLLEVQGQLAMALAGGGAALLLEGFQTPWFTIQPWKMHYIFLLDGATYVLGFSIILFIRYKSLVERKAETGSIPSRMQTGWLYLQKNPMIFLFGLASYMVFVFVLLHAFSLGTIFIKEYLESGGATFAISEIGYSVGAILAGVGVRWLFRNTDTVKAIILMTLTTGFLIPMILVLPWISIFYVALFVLGFTNAGIRVMRVNYLFKRIPNQVIGRANSIFTVFNILARIVLLFFFMLPFFHIGYNVIFGYIVLMILLYIAAFILWQNYKRIMDAG